MNCNTACWNAENNKYQFLSSSHSLNLTSIWRETALLLTAPFASIHRKSFWHNNHFSATWFPCKIISVTHLPNQLQYWNVPRKTQENVNLFCSVVMDLTQYLLSNSKNVNASSQELTNEKDSRIVNVSGFRWYGVYVPYCYKFQKILKIQVQLCLRLSYITRVLKP